jgi:hypothetical protein
VSETVLGEVRTVPKISCLIIKYLLGKRLLAFYKLFKDMYLHHEVMLWSILENMGIFFSPKRVVPNIQHNLTGDMYADCWQGSQATVARTSAHESTYQRVVLGGPEAPLPNSSVFESRKY